VTAGASRPEGADLGRVTQDYRPILLRFLPHRAEEVRAAAYELGRSAFAGGVPLLDMCRIHLQVTAEVLREAPAEDVLRIHDAASELLLEVLAAYEMTHRGAVGR
jgi:hypothetical protein